MNRVGVWSVFLFIALTLSCQICRAGQTSAFGTIAGTVQDNTPAVVPGASITVTSATGATQTATSDEKGEYRILGLTPGTYKLTVSATGFKDFEISKVVVTAGDTARMDATVVPAGVSSTISVQSSAAMEVQTESAQITNEITTAEIETLGLNGRNFTALAALAPGVSNQSGQDEALVGIKGSVKYSVNGGRVEYNTYDVDGGDILNTSINGSTSTLIVFPSVDAIEAMQVLTSNYGAMYGRSASGTITATTKSGTNSFHGDAYFYFRNNHLNARNFFDQPGPAPLYHKYDQGGTIGGPLYIPGHYNTNKDKTYFFFSEEYRHERAPQTFNQGVPSLQERDCTKGQEYNSGPNPYCVDALAGTTAIRDYSTYGDFSDVCPSVMPGNSFSMGGSAVFSRAKYPDCPGKPTSAVGSFDSYPGNLVPIDPISQQILNTGLIPAPTPGATNCNSSIGSCYVATFSPLTTWREELLRIDHNFTPKEKLYFRYIHDTWSTVSLTPQWGYVQNSFPTVQNQFTGPGLSMVAHWTSTISNSFVNDAGFSYTTDHINLTDIPANSGVNLTRPASFGNPVCISDINPNNPTANCGMGSIFAPGSGVPYGGKLPGIVISGTNAAYGSKGFAVDPSYMPWHHSNPTYNMRDDATLVRGNHTISFGIQVVIAQRNEINPPVGANSGDVQGLATFTDINNRNTSGNAFADFLGTPTGTSFNFTTGTSEILPGPPAIQAFQQDSGQGDYHNNYTTFEPYVQDDWKVTHRLTLNLGLRFSLFGLYHEKYLQSYNWVPTAFSSTLASQVFVNPSSGALEFTGGSPVPITLEKLNPSLVNGIEQCGVNGIPAGCMTNRWLNPSPRIGFAWDPTGSGRTSIRAGYGIFFEHGTGNEANTGSLEGSPGFPGGVLDMTQYYPTSWGCIGSGCNGTGVQGAFPLNVTSIPTKVVWPYVQQWSLSVQRQLPGSLLGSIAYVGTKGTNLTTELQVNQLVPVNPSQNPFIPGQPLGDLNAGPPGTPVCEGFNQGLFTVNGNMIGASSPVFVNLEAACAGINNQIPTPNALRTPGSAIAPGMGQIFSLQNIASSSYEALQVTLRRSSGGLSLGVSYSYSHSFDNSSDRTTAAFINAYDLRENRASSDFDQRHLLNINYTYDLAHFGKFLSEFGQWAITDIGAPKATKGSHSPSRLEHYLGGWQLSGITLFATGTPFSVLNGGSPNGVSSADNAGVAAGLGPGTYPDVVPAGPMPVVSSSKLTFGPLLGNSTQFVAPTGLTYGNAGRNFLNNPAQLNFDVSLIRDVKIRESATLEFRIETFNLFNHTQFRIYDPANPGNTGNNVITCYGGPTPSSLNIAAYSAGDASCTGSSSFLHPVDAHQSRTLQLGVKFLF